MKLFKLAITFFVAILILTILVIIYDLAYYDPSYINRSQITFNVNNLNSKKVKKLFKYPEKFIYYLGYKFSKKQREFWRPEDLSVREKLPKIIKISGKKDNFLPGTEIEKIEKNFSNWPRSHGGFTSTRFSSLKKN